MRIDEEYERAIYNARNIEELEALLIEINKNSKNISYRPRDVRLYIFRAMRDLVGESYKQSRKVVLHDLWPICIEKSFSESEEDEDTVIQEADGTKVYRPSRRSEDMWEADSARDLLASWVMFWNEKGRQGLRNEIHDFACGLALNDGAMEEVAAACWVFSHLGWRSAKTEETLWRVLKRDDKAGDIAGHVFANLGVPATLRSQFIAQLRARAQQRPTRYNGHPMVKLAEPSLVEDAIQMFYAQSELDWSYGMPHKKEPKERVSEEKIWFLSSLSEALWNYEDIQEQIWDVIYKSCHGSREGRWSLLFMSDVFTRCHTPKVIHDFLAMLPDAVADTEKQSLENIQEPDVENGDPIHWPLYLASERLSKALSPRQLSAWSSLNPELLQPFQRLSVLDTQSNVNFVTPPVDVKEGAWQMLAFAGGVWNTNDIQIALKEERSGYVHNKVAETVACFGCDPLPSIVIERLTDDDGNPFLGKDLYSDKDSSRFSSLRGMENLARATATREAFDALLNFGYTYHKDMLRSTSDALEDVAAWLIQQGDESISEELWKAAFLKSVHRRRIAAISALHGLAGAKLLPSSDWEKFIPLAEEPELGDYFRALAVQAIGFYGEEEIKIEAHSTLVSLWKEGRSKTRIELAGRARESLARHGTWKVEAADEYLNDIGLELRDGEWRAKTSGMIESDDMAALSFIYRDDNQTFLQAVCDILERPRLEATYSLTFWLMAREWGQSPTLDSKIAETMVKRLSQIQYDVPHYIFSALSLGAPGHLLRHEWSKEIQKWPGDALVSLADAMAHADYGKGALPISTFNTLELLIHNDSFAVRRAAIRAWYCLDKDIFEKRCNQLAVHRSAFERQIAAESVFWWEKPLKDKRQKDIQELLLNDREKRVREAAEEGRKTHRNKRWADDYWERVNHAALTQSSAGECYAYGFALQSLGDDGHLHQIDYANYRVMHPAIRFWLRQIREELQKNWEKKSRDWNLISEGAITEATEGTLEASKGNEINVDVWLWLKPRAGVRGVSSWGGSLESKQGTPFELSGNEKGWVLKLEDGRQGRVMIGSSNFSIGLNQKATAQFFGQDTLQ